MRIKWILALGLALAVMVAVGATAEGPNRVRNCVDCPSPVPDAPRLPVTGPGGDMKIFRAGEATSVLQLDDGTCEGGLGAGVAVTSYQQYAVPTQCVTGGLEIVAVTSRMNTNAAQSLAFAQDGPAPGVGGFSTTPAAFGPLGACPATAVQSVNITPGAAVITGTGNFWAGLANTGFAGRDSNTPGNVWLNCALCGMTQYSPGVLTGLGLGGTWMLRLTVEDQNCVPVELMGVSVD